MRKLALVILFALLALPVKAGVSEETLEAHLLWLEENTEYEWDGTIPTIEYVDEDTLMTRFYGSDWREKTTDPIWAVYDQQLEGIFILKGLDSYDLQPLLVHELLHHLQEKSGAFESTDCRARLEQEAHQTHWAWMDEFGYPDDHKFRTNKLWVLTMTMGCGGHY